MLTLTWPYYLLDKNGRFVDRLLDIRCTQLEIQAGKKAAKAALPYL
jgi:hypothetical protein